MFLLRTSRVPANVDKLGMSVTRCKQEHFKTSSYIKGYINPYVGLEV